MSIPVPIPQGPNNPPPAAPAWLPSDMAVLAAAAITGLLASQQANAGNVCEKAVSIAQRTWSLLAAPSDPPPPPLFQNPLP